MDIISIIATITEKISFAFSIITVPFYTLTIFALIHAQIKGAPVLTGSFFKLCITAGINDIVTLINYYFGAAFPQWGWFTEVYLAIGKPCVYMYLIIERSSIINQALSVSVLATNRLSALLFPLQHHKLWGGFRLKLAMLVQIAPGYIFASFILLSDVKFLEWDGRLMPSINDDRVLMAYGKAAIIFLILNSVFLIVAHCYLFYAVRNRNKSQSEAIFLTRMQRPRIKDMYRRAEFRLFIMSSIIVAMQLLHLLIFSATELPCPSWLSFAALLVIILYCPLTVLYSGISPYLLWICSDELRRHVLAMLKIKK